MYEELINSLRYCATHSCMGEAPALTGCTAIYDDAPKDCDSCNAVLQWRAADAIEELQGRAKVLEKVADKWCEAVPRWIPVTERLPKERRNPNTSDFEYVLCTTIWGDVRPFKYGTQIGQRVAHFWNGAGYVDAYVTHWMPLPAPPAVDTEEQP